MTGAAFLALLLQLGLVVRFSLANPFCGTPPRPHCRNVPLNDDPAFDSTHEIMRAITENRADDSSQEFETWDATTSSWLYNEAARYSSRTDYARQVFIPKGRFTVKRSLPLPYYTQLVGAGVDETILEFLPDEGYCSSGQQRSVVDAFGYEWVGEGLRPRQDLPPEGATWTPQNNFYRRLADLTIDMTAVSASGCVGIGWTLSQATSLSNVRVIMGKGSDSVGLFMAEGSGGMLADVEFEGGKLGMEVGNQQFTCRNVTVRDASEAGVHLIWGWQWVFKSLTVINSPVGLRFGSGEPSGSAGAVTLLDSSFLCVGVGVELLPSLPQSDNTYGEAHVALDNVMWDPNRPLRGHSDGKPSSRPPRGHFDGNPSSFTVVRISRVDPKDDEALLIGPPRGWVEQWVYGNIWYKHADHAVRTTLDIPAVYGAVARPEALAPPLPAEKHHGPRPSPFFEMGRPSWASWHSSRPESDARFIDVTAPPYSAVGDGVTIVSRILQRAVDDAARQGDILFLPHGRYMLDETLHVPSGSRILGEAWTNLVAADRPSGSSAFGNSLEPVPLVQVGREGERGMAHLVDLNLLASGPQPGCIMLQWHLGQIEPGDTGMWDVHMRVGGSVGTLIRNTNCSRLDGIQDLALCGGVHLLMHISRGGSVYVEGTWGWVADHDLDSPAPEGFRDQINVFNARGFLCESLGPVFLYGTGFEHSLLYQYNFDGAANVFAAMLQTETPYMQPVTPFMHSQPSIYFNELQTLGSDPRTASDFCTEAQSGQCEMSLALRLKNSSNIWIYGAGFYSFFNSWSQDCIVRLGPNNRISPDCQAHMLSVSDSVDIHTLMLSVHGGVFMKELDDLYSRSRENLMALVSTAIFDGNTRENGFSTAQPLSTKRECRACI
jgi:glucan 1,3-beta-glucosidase